MIQHLTLCLSVTIKIFNDHNNPMREVDIYDVGVLVVIILQVRKLRQMNWSDEFRAHIPYHHTILPIKTIVVMIAYI